MLGVELGSHAHYLDRRGMNFLDKLSSVVQSECPQRKPIPKEVWKEGGTGVTKPTTNTCSL